MKKIAFAVLCTLGLVACGSSSSNEPAPTPFTKPTGYVAVSFSVNDTANKVYGNGDLAWKGAMKYTEATRIIEKDDTWGGPFAPLYDDGAWDTVGGHEPHGATAGDHIVGTTVFIKPPATQAEVDAGKGSVGYGLIDVKYDKPVAEGGFGNGWIWVGDNGNFTIPLNSTTDVTATGMTVPAFGTIDLKLTLDANNLAVKDPVWDTSKVEVKGSAWAWGAVTIADNLDGATDGVYTFTLSSFVGSGKPFNHTGLLKSGQAPEFVWVLGGAEYKVGGICSDVGAKAYTKPSGGAFAEQAITLAGNNNTMITVP